MPAALPDKGANMTPRSFTTTAYQLACITGIVALAGCAKKPPACGADETMALARKVIIDNAREAPAVFQYFQSAATIDPDKLMEKYLDSVKLQLTSITSDGYDDKAKRNSCHAQMSIKADGVDLSGSVAYTTQVTEDKDGGWVIEMENVKQASMQVGIEAASYFAAHRFAGSWRGNYACAGLDGQTGGPRGPFSMPVTATIDSDNSIKLDRTTAGGGYESLKGTVGLGNGAVALQGEGANSPDDQWKAAYSGKIAGTTLRAQGGIQPRNVDDTGRTCTLTLERQPAPTAASN
jgi:hypothetical protein